MEKTGNTTTTQEEMHWKPIKFWEMTCLHFPLVDISHSNHIFCLGKLHDPTFPRLVEIASLP